MSARSWDDSLESRAAAAPGRGDAIVESALRTVLAVALTRDEASLLVAQLGGDGVDDVDDVFDLWPSTLYSVLARQALASRTSWQRVAGAVDRRLSPWSEPFRGCPAIELVQDLRDRRDIHEAEDLVALLWALLCRESHVLGTMLARAAREVELALLQTAARPRTEAAVWRQWASTDENQRRGRLH